MPTFAANHARLDELRAPPAAVAELGPGQDADQCQALERTVLAYLREGWRVEGRRCFLMEPDTGWNSMEKFVNNELAPRGGKRQKFDWHSPGHDLVAVWKIGMLRPDFVATAMADEPVEGKPLVAYFTLVRK
jgi:hypothetical protein